MDFATQRYLSLVHLLVQRHGGGYGAVTRTAEDLGVSRAYVHELLKGKRTRVGKDAMRKAHARLKTLKPDYFEERVEPTLAAGRALLNEAMRGSPSHENVEDLLEAVLRLEPLTKAARRAQGAAEPGRSNQALLLAGKVLDVMGDRNSDALVAVEEYFIGRS